MTVKAVPVYDYSIAIQPGVVGPNNFMSLFNPTGSGVALSVGAVFISNGAVNATSSIDPMRGFRISAASGGTLVPTTEIAKFITYHPDPAAEVRTANPTVTLGPALFNSPPVITTGTGGSDVHDVLVPPGSGPFLLLPGEGLVVRTAAGDLDQRWNISMVWGERR